MYNIPYDGKNRDIFLNSREIEIARDKIKPNNGKPLLLLHTHGGGNQQYSKKSWYRDMPVEIAQEVVNKLKKD